MDVLRFIPGSGGGGGGGERRLGGETKKYGLSGSGGGGGGGGGGVLLVLFGAACLNKRDTRFGELNFTKTENHSNKNKMKRNL